LFATDSAYAKPPAWVTDGALPPGLQNHSLPGQFWENGLKKFKVSFEIVRQSAAQQSSQGTIKDDIIYYYHNDHLGTPCFLTDEAGAIVWRREQTPFGVTSYERGTTTENLRFPGQYWDAEKQSSYNIYRDGYTPSLGRYGQADPIGQNSGVNVYSYTGGNSMNYLDPWGLGFITLEEGQQIVDSAKEWEDTPYNSTPGSNRWKSTGADCSGSTWAIYHDAGYDYSYLKYGTTAMFSSNPLFKKSPNNSPQVGDVGLYSGHMVIYDPNAGKNRNVWSAHHTNGPPYGPGRSSWYGTPTWYRYYKPDMCNNCH
jgi:RHS repeat-associated protein